MLDTLSFLFSHAFMLRALVVGGLISLCCALLGMDPDCAVGRGRHIRQYPRVHLQLEKEQLF